MPKMTFDLKNGTLKADVYVQCTRDWECPECATTATLTMEFPEGLAVNGAITVNGAKCPNCGEPVIIPHGRHYIKDYKLLTEETPTPHS